LNINFSNGRLFLFVFYAFYFIGEWAVVCVCFELIRSIVGRVERHKDYLFETSFTVGARTWFVTCPHQQVRCIHFPWFFNYFV